MSGTALVVGAGVTGAAVARELARRGFDVTLAEQYATGTVRSASGGDTRLLRASHGGDGARAEPPGLRGEELGRAARVQHAGFGLPQHRVQAVEPE
jgi:glycine/D-amino acid oxidase-like deaminating enzyme